MIAQLIHGGLWFTSRVELAGRSPVAVAFPSSSTQEIAA